MFELLGVLTAAALSCASAGVPCSAEPMAASAAIERQGMEIPKPAQKPQRKTAAKAGKSDKAKPRTQVATLRQINARKTAGRNRLVLLIGNYY